jgi:hypothetical protein
MYDLIATPLVAEDARSGLSTQGRSAAQNIEARDTPCEVREIGYALGTTDQSNFSRK